MLLWLGGGGLFFGLQIIFINTKNIYKSECFIYTQEFVESFAQVTCMCIFSSLVYTKILICQITIYQHIYYSIRDISL